MSVESIGFDGVITIFTSQPLKLGTSDLTKAFNDLFKVIYSPEDMDNIPNYTGFSILSLD